MKKFFSRFTLGQKIQLVLFCGFLGAVLYVYIPFWYFTMTAPATFKIVKIPKSTYHVVEAPNLAMTRNASGSYVRWYDNETIAYRGANVGKPQNEKEHQEFHKHVRLYFWKPGEKPEPLKEFEAGSKLRLCFEYRSIRIYVRDKTKGLITKRHILEGPRDQLKLNIHFLDKTGTDRRKFRDIIPGTCEGWQNNSLIGQIWAPLQPKGAYLDFGKIIPIGKPKEAIQLFSPDHPNGKALEIPQLEVSSVTGQFYRFNGAHLFANYGVPPNWKRTNCFPYWLIWSDGRTERHCIPWGPYHKGGHYLALTKAGMFYANVNTTGKQSAGYLIKDGQYKKIITGIIENPRTSPDGCRVAFSIAGDTRDLKFLSAGRGNRAAILDVCAGPQSDTMIPFGEPK